MTSRQDNYKSYSKLAQIYNCSETIHPALVEKVLQKEGNINCQFPAHSRFSWEKPDLAGGTALHIAAIKNDEEIFNILLHNGAEFTIQNQQGRTVLHCIFDKVKVKPKLLDTVLSTHLSLGDSRNPCDKNGVSHFHIACMSNKVDVVEFFLNSGIPVDIAVNASSEKYAGYTPLHFAAEGCALPVIKLLLRHKANTSFKDARGLTPLHVLLQRKIDMMDSYGTSNTPIAEMDDTLNQLLDSNNVDHLGLTRFHVACTMQDSSVAEYFLEQNIDVDRQVNMDSPFYPGYTALHFAAHCNLDTAKKLLRRKAQYEIGDANGLTPMDLFWRLNRRKDLLAILEVNWEYVTFSDKQIRLIDFISSTWNEEELLAYLWKVTDLTTVINEVPTCWMGRTLLHFAVLVCKSFDTMRILMEHGFFQYVDVRDFDGTTPIHLAFRADKLYLVDTMMKYSVGYRNFVDKDHLSYLHIACALRKNAHVERFCQFEENLNVACRRGYANSRIKSGSTALHVAVASGHSRNVIALLKRGLNLEAKDANGETPLHRFLRLKYDVDGVYQAFMRSSTDSMLQVFGLTRLHMAIYCNDPKVLQYVHSDTVNAVVSCDDPSSFWYSYDGCTPLHVAIKHRETFEVMESLIEKGADLLAPNRRGESPLYAALTGSPNSETMPWIVEKLQFDETLRKQMEEMSGITMLHIACHLVNVDAVGWLLIGKVDVEARVKSDCPVWTGCTPFHVLLKTIEYYGVSEDLCRIFELLLRKGADVSAVDGHGETPIHLVLQKLSAKRIHEVLTLLVATIRVFNFNPVNRDGISHFHAACLVKNPPAVKLFLENNVDVNQPIDFFALHFAGETPLHLAVESKIEVFFSSENKRETVDLLLSYGADVRAEDSRGYTPLHMAVETGEHLDFIEKFVAHGATLDTRNIFLQTPLEWLLQSDNLSVEAIKYFKNAGCRLNARNPLTKDSYVSMLISRRYRPMYEGVQNETVAERQQFGITKIECLNIMVDAIDASVFDDMGRNLIHDIVTTRDPNCALLSYNDLIKRLLSRGVDVDLQDSEGKTALHLAAEFANFSAVQGLLDAGADVNVVDATNQSALEHAVESYQKLDPIIKKNQAKSDCEFKVVVHLFYNVVALQRWDLEVSVNNLRARMNAYENVISSRSHYNPEQYGNYRWDKSQLIADSELCLGDFLSEKGKGLISYAFMSDERREKVDRFFHDNSDCLKGVCMLQYRKAVKRVRLVKLAMNSVWTIARLTVPIDCVEMIFQYLKNSELENLIKATDVTDL